MKLILQHDTMGEERYSIYLAIPGYIPLFSASYKPGESWSYINFMNDEEIDIEHDNSLFSSDEMAEALRRNVREYEDGDKVDRWGVGPGQEHCGDLENRCLNPVVSDVDVLNWLLENEIIQKSLISGVWKWNLLKAKSSDYTKDPSVTIIEF